MSQELGVQDAIVEAVRAGINLAKSLGLIPAAGGDPLRHSTGMTRLDEPILGSQKTAIKREQPSTRDADSVRIYVYVFGCRGCMRIAKDLNSKVYKIGSTIESDLAIRLEQVGQEQYGACFGQKDRFETQDGFSNWVALPISVSRPSAHSNITILPRAIAVDLPHGMTRQAFDARLQKALQSRALHELDTGPKRFTSYAMGGVTRISEAKEFYEFSPASKVDGDMLLSAIETIIRP